MGQGVYSNRKPWSSPGIWQQTNPNGTVHLKAFHALALFVHTLQIVHFVSGGVYAIGVEMLL